MTTKFSCHIVMELFYVYFREQMSTISMCEIFIDWNVFERSYA